MLQSTEIAKSFDTRHMNLFLFPTERCNFRCTYCYEDFAVGQMPPTVRDGVKALLSKRLPDLSSIDIHWFGGEPLVAQSVIEDISLHIVQLANSWDGHYRAAVTTNGYLLDVKTAIRLRRLGVTSYQISLDGPAAVHDTSRRRADGAGTFDQIWANLEGIRRSALDVSVLLRVHFSPETFQALDPLIDAINNTFSGDARFSVFFKAIERLGGPNDGATPLFSDGDKRTTRQRLVDKLSTSIRAHEIASDGGTYVCYASKPNAFIIRADGTVAKCTVALYDERNRVGKLTPTGEIAMDQGKVRWWMRGFASLRDDELSCPNGAGRRDDTRVRLPVT